MIFYFILQFRLKNLPVKQRIYIIEGLGRACNVGLPQQTLNQAACNTQVIDGFIVKYTSNFDDTLRYLQALNLKFRKLLKVSVNLFYNKTILIVIILLKN